MGFGPRHALTSEPEKVADAGKTVRRLLAYFRPFRWMLVAVGGLLVLGALLQLTAPILPQVAIDYYLEPSDQPTQSVVSRLVLALVPAAASPAAGLTAVMLLLLAVYLLNYAVNLSEFYLMTLVAQRLLRALRSQIFERIQVLSLSFFDQHEAGDLMSRLVNDTEVINQVFSFGLVRLLSLSLSLTGIVISMFLLSWQLALAAFVSLPLMVVTTVFFSRRARAAFRRTRKTIGAVSAELQENIAGVREVQAFARENENVAEFQQVNRANRDANVQAETITSAFSPALDVFSTIALAVVVGFGGSLVLRGLISVGLIVSFLIYVRRFYEPIQGIAGMLTQLQSALAGAERIFELLDTQPQVQDAPGAQPLPPVEGRVEFDHVTFAYGDEPVLEDVSLVAEPGQTVAIVGPTGAGKTTIINLLTRFYDVPPDDGAVHVDGYDVRDVTQESLRSQIGLVLQDTFLFSGTILDNIRYGRLDASDEEVIAAAKLANADNFIRKQPEGYQTQIGERGHNLSQGQRQLLSIARAILKNPRVLILDEATSSVDTRTELLIQRALGELLGGRTSFVIAHRLSTIRNADQVLVLQGGRLVERGTHSSLLAAGGVYHDLYMSQFRRQAELGEGQQDGQGPCRQPALAGRESKSTA